MQPRPELFKTKFCMQFLASGVCFSGDGCRYAHTPAELRAAEREVSAQLLQRGAEGTQREVAALQGEELQLRNGAGESPPNTPPHSDLSLLAHVEARAEEDLAAMPLPRFSVGGPNSARAAAGGARDLC